MRDQPSDPREDVAEIPAVDVADDRRPRHREFEDREPSAGREHARHLAARHRRLLHVADAERDGHGIDALRWQRQPHRITTRQTDGRTARGEARITFSRPSRSISPEKSTPTTDAARPRCASASATSAVPVQTIERAFAAGQRERSHGARAPVAIHAAAQHGVQQIVAARDLIEHARDLLGRLVGQRNGRMTASL